MTLEPDTVYDLWKKRNLNIIYDIRGDKEKFEYFIYIGNKKKIPSSFIKKHCKRDFFLHISSIIFAILNPLKFVRMNFLSPGFKYYKCYLTYKYNPDFLCNSSDQDTKEHYRFFRESGFYLNHELGWHFSTPMEEYLQRLRDGNETEDFPVIIFDRNSPRFFLTTVKQFQKREYGEHL